MAARVVMRSTIGATTVSGYAGRACHRDGPFRMPVAVALALGYQGMAHGNNDGASGAVSSSPSPV